MNKRRRRNAAPLLLGVIVIAIGLMILLSSVILKDWITIGFGVRTLNLVKSIGKTVTAGGVVLTALLSIPLVRSAMRQQQERKRQSQFITDYAEDVNNPELTRKMLGQMQKDNAYFDEIVTECRVQMDKMDGLQAKQARLLKANDALYLSETEEILNRVEQRICRNIRNIINMCMAVDHPRALDAEKVERIFGDNERKLSDAAELIQVSVKRINQYIQGQGEDLSEVKKWIETIRESLEED